MVAQISVFPPSVHCSDLHLFSRGWWCLIFKRTRLFCSRLFFIRNGSFVSFCCWHSCGDDSCAAGRRLQWNRGRSRAAENRAEAPVEELNRGRVYTQTKHKWSEDVLSALLASSKGLTGLNSAQRSGASLSWRSDTRHISCRWRSTDRQSRRCELARLCMDKKKHTRRWWWSSACEEVAWYRRACSHLAPLTLHHRTFPSSSPGFVSGLLLFRINSYLLWSSQHIIISPSDELACGSVGADGSMCISKPYVTSSQGILTEVKLSWVHRTK